MQSSQIARPSSVAGSEADLRTALAVILRESLRPFAAGLSALYVVFAVSHVLMQPEAVAALMIPVAVGTAALLLGLYLVLGRWSIPSHWAHPLATGMAGLVLLNSLFHLSLLSEPQQTTNLMLLAVGVGCFFLSTGWLVLVLAATVGGWGLVAWGAVPSPAWVHFGFGLLTATVLSLLVHTVRMRVFRRLEWLRIQDERRKRELEEAVQVQQQSEEALRKVHDELELRVRERTAELVQANEVLQAEIIERRQVEGALRTSELKFRSVAQSAKDAIISADSGGNIIFWNTGAQNIFGYREEDVLGKPLTLLMPERYRAAHRRGLERLYATGESRLLGKTVELYGLKKGGQKFPLELSLAAWKTEEGAFSSGIIRDISERKRAEEELIRLSTAVRMSTDSIVICDLEAKIVSVNDATLKMYGTADKGDLLGKSGFDLVVLEDRAKAFAGMEETLDKGFVQNREYQVVIKDGSTVPVEISVALMEDARGKPMGFVGVSRDITEHKRAEAALRRSEEHFRLLIENASDIIILLNGDGTVRYQSPAAERILGNRPEDTLGKSGFAFIHPDDLPHVMNVFAEALQRPGLTPAMALRVRHKDGSWRVLEVLGNNLLDHPAVGGVIINTRDVTERHRLEAALQRERDLLEVTLASIGDAVITTDATAALTFMNAVAERLTGWSVQEAVGRGIGEVFPLIHEHSGQPVEDPVGKVLREQVVVGLANRAVLLTRDGRRVPIADNGAPIRDTSGQVHGAVVVFRDVTESRQAEAALLQAKEAAEVANRAKSEFLATMSHELRTPLNVILGYTDLLLDETFGRLSVEQTRPLHRINRSAKELLDLISAVLDVSRLEAGRLPLEVQVVGVAAVLEEVKAEMQSMQEHSGLEFVWEVESGLPPLYTDAGKLKIVLKNLIGNAVKFTTEGRITVGAYRRRGGIEVRVTDTGRGIPVEEQERIFEPFRQLDASSTREHGGVGLGLHIVKRLLEVLGGTVGVESELSRGSTFRVWLPPGARRD